MYRLTHLSGPSKGKRHAVHDATVVVGRDPSCAILVQDDEVSLKHAELEQRKDGVYIRDLGSMNGILVNNALVRDARLKHNDVIELGRTRFQFQEVIEAEEGHVRQMSFSQGLTLAASALIILLELAFLVGLSVLRQDALKVVVHPHVLTDGNGKPPARPVDKQPVSTGEKATLAEAEAHLKDLEHRQEAHTVAASTSVAETVASDVSHEIEKLREDVATLREQVQTIAVGPTSAPPAAAATNAEAAPPAPPPDPLQRKAEAMLQEASILIRQSNLLQADDQLNRIQILAPDFLPAYVERARLFEKRGMLQKAGEQWAEVLSRSIGTPLYEQAAAERIRVARAQMTALTAAPPQKKDDASGERLPRRVRILNIEQEKFPENDQFEEMRILRVILKPAMGEKNIDSTEIQVTVSFFDEEKDSGDIVRTRALVPKEALRVDGEWRPGDQRIVTASYMVPQGFRNEEQAKFGERRRFFGYLARVYYRGELQDEDARPKTLFETAAKLPEPVHAPAQP